MGVFLKLEDSGREMMGVVIRLPASSKPWDVFFAPQMMLFLFNEDNKEIAVYRRETWHDPEVARHSKCLLPNSWCCLPWKGRCMSASTVFLLHDWHESNLGLDDCPVHFVCVSNVRSSPHLGRLQFLQLSSSFFCLPMFCLFLLQERMVQTTCTSMQWRKVMICDKCKPQKILSMASTLCTVFKENAAGWSGDSIPLYRSHGPCW